MIKIDLNKCTRCCGCIDTCSVPAIDLINDVITVDEDLCTGCGACAEICPMEACHEE